MPTQVGLLEHGGNLLVLYRMSKDQTLHAAKDRMFRRMIKYSTPEAPGDVTILVYTGIANTTGRELTEYTPFGPERKIGPVPASTEDIRARIYEWWQDAGRR